MQRVRQNSGNTCFFSVKEAEVFFFWACYVIFYILDGTPKSVSPGDGHSGQQTVKSSQQSVDSVVLVISSIFSMVDKLKIYLTTKEP